MTRELKLALALQSMLRWPYMTDMWEHIAREVPEGKDYDHSYIGDIAMIREGVKAARELGITMTNCGPLSR